MPNFSPNTLGFSFLTLGTEMSCPRLLDDRELSLTLILATGSPSGTELDPKWCFSLSFSLLSEKWNCHFGKNLAEIVFQILIQLRKNITTVVWYVMKVDLAEWSILLGNLVGLNG